VHIGLQMCKRKFIFIKYTHPYSYTKFGTFFVPLGILTHLESPRAELRGPKNCGPKFKNGGDMAIGAKNGKPLLSRNWWTLVHIFWHFWKALGQGYKTPKICGPKFNSGGIQRQMSKM